jgi:hypothetical protein
MDPAHGLWSDGQSMVEALEPAPLEVPEPPEEEAMPPVVGGLLLEDLLRCLFRRGLDLDEAPPELESPDRWSDGRLPPKGRECWKASMWPQQGQ